MNISEEDLRKLKAVAAILESIAVGGKGVKYMPEALDEIAGMLYEVIEKAGE